MIRKRYITGIAVLVILLIVAVAGVAFAGSKQQAGKPGRANLHQDFTARFAANLGVDQAKVTEALEAARLNKQAGIQDKANLHQEYMAKFAASLGVDQAKVTEALEATKKQLLDEAVAKGDLTQEQADKIAAKKSGTFGFGGIHENKKHSDKRGGKFNFMGKDMEKILGITPEQLKEELKSGKNWQQIVTDHGLTVEQFHQKMLENKKEALSKAVADGKLTQDQYDKMIKRMEQRSK